MAAISFKGRHFQQDMILQSVRWYLAGIVKLSEFDKKLGKARIHNSLIVQHSCSWPEVENRLNST
ncbi:MAG: hypothetical protein VST68_10940 [Nitrospirota bacterium]|nr:hypothetical protein [Nitrospirota bacterium]